MHTLVVVDIAIEVLVLVDIDDRPLIAVVEGVPIDSPPRFSYIARD
jgi:hypothetical protein